LALISLVLAACAPAAAPTTVPPAATTTPMVEPSNTPQPAPTQAATASGNGYGSGAGQGVTVNIAQNATLGAILVDGNGMTLYAWKNDQPGISTCNAKCLANWPPLLATGMVTAGAGLNASDFGTTQTTDGKTMVTYNNEPLYYFIGDKAAGDTKGQGIGNVWFVVAPLSSTGSVSQPATQGLVVNISQNTKLGNILVDSKGMTLYTWKNDKPGVSNCAGQCLANWPPLVASGMVTAGTGLNDSDFGTTQSTDGRTMVTYKGAPLYYFIGDKATGDTNGQGIGNVWFVAAP
jgi:predicted lipoprotein with Yx(FWY)xxD motif